MRRRLLVIVGVLTIVLALAYVARPAGHVPPFDANLVRLAETELEGYCSGETFWRTQGNGDAGRAADCRAERTGTIADDVNLHAVEAGFCRAVIAEGWEGDVPACLGILEGNQLWPTYDGGITRAWNRARPYPLTAIQVPGPGASDSSRTGGREAPSRVAPGGVGRVPEVQPQTETQGTETTETNGNQ